jgi:hypothetical protein
MQRVMQTRKRDGGLTLAFVVIGVVMALLGLSYRRTHTAAGENPHSVPARESSAPSNGSPGSTTPSQESSGDRNG